jgi:predicted glycoside hydrolase/deacetylase ChbG (UPF0249 family)
MSPNPLLKRLGLNHHDRVVIFHADDIGMCQASVAAYQELVAFGLMSSAAAMTPCAWFPHAAALSHTFPTPPDLGVHLTLTSEWDNYRWGPLSTRDTTTGLLDSEGYLHRTSEAVQAQASPEAVLQEAVAQVQKALAAGLDVTHLDSHMGTLFHPKFLPAYLQVAQQFGLPALLARYDAAQLQAMGFPADTAVMLAQQVMMLEEQVLPLLDSINGLWLDKPDNRLEQAKELLDSLGPGVHYFIFHPSVDTPELRAIAPDWRARVEDYKLFLNPAWREYVQASGVHVLGWRAIRDLDK